MNLWLLAAISWALLAAATWLSLPLYRQRPPASALDQFPIAQEEIAS